MRLPSGDTRGNSYGAGGSFSGATIPFLSINATSIPAEADAGPGENTSDPLSETLKNPAGVVPVALRTPSTTGADPPETSSRRTLNGIANSTPPAAYTM